MHPVYKPHYKNDTGGSWRGLGVRGWGGQVGSSLCISQSSFSVICCCLGCQVGFICVRVLDKFENICYQTSCNDLENVRLAGFNSWSLNPFSLYQGAAIHRGQQRYLCRRVILLPGSYFHSPHSAWEAISCSSAWPTSPSFLMTCECSKNSDRP